MFDFKGLIKAIMRKESDDPVGSLKSATIWVQELPQSDIHHALQEILKALAKLNKNQVISLKERSRVLFYLDEKARPLQENLCRDYLAGIDAPTPAPHHKISTILLFWDLMSVAYYNFLRAYAEDPQGKIQPQLPLLTAKALHYHAMQAKWRYLRYLPVEAQTWRHLSHLYSFAESAGFLHTPVNLYPNQPQTTCAQEYLQPMMLHLANPASLLPAQIEMVDLWLDSWSSSLEIEKEFRPHRQLYAINLSDMNPARKLRRNMVGEKYRYWGIGLLLVAINQVTARLKEGELPMRLKLGEGCRLPACLNLIEDIAKRWSGESTKRKHVRIASNKPLLVVEGVSSIFSQLQGGKKPLLAETKHNVDLHQHTTPPQEKSDILSASAEPELFKPTLQKWLMRDESAEGLSASFANESGNRLVIGTLLGIKKPGGKHFAVGIVRRISRENSHDIHVGVQIWSQTPLPVELSEIPRDEKTLPVAAIYLPESAKLEIGRSLLMPSHAYGQGKQMRIEAQGKSYTIRWQEAVEYSQENTRARFSVVTKDRDAPAVANRIAP
jgi:hypothetical protein